jgi:hypothetical protein
MVLIIRLYYTYKISIQGYTVIEYKKEHSILLDYYYVSIIFKYCFPLLVLEVMELLKGYTISYLNNTYTSSFLFHYSKGIKKVISSFIIATNSLSIIIGIILELEVYYILGLINMLYCYVSNLIRNN